MTNATPIDRQTPLPAAVHLVGIGGMHMSAIAQILLAAGVRVSGSDSARSAMTERLAALGATVYQGHAAAQLGDAALVVTTAAAKPENPELVAAARRGVPVISRAAMVARLMAGRVGVCVAGTHGKTTTSTMITWLLREAGRDPSFLLGGVSPAIGTNAAAGAGREIVVEADEYARAFLEYSPSVAVITNVEADHLEYYGSVAAYEDAFRQFMARVRPDGVLIVCADSPRLDALAAAGAPAALERYRVLPDDADAPAPYPEWLARDHGPSASGGHRFSVRYRGEPFGAFTLPVPGTHNVANALGAIAAGAALGLTAAEMAPALAGFRNAARRFDLVGEADGVTVIDDFSHHPTEIRAALAAARGRYPGRRIVAVFQPHTYSRTAYLFEEFRGCFAGADRLFILETFGSRETAEAGLSARDLADAVTGPPAEYLPTAEDAAERLAEELRKDDVLLTIGAGDIERLGRMVLERRRA